MTLQATENGSSSQTTQATRPGFPTPNITFVVGPHRFVNITDKSLGLLRAETPEEDAINILQILYS
jgi:hypothetical protein